jgi:hypothetical protein
VGGNWDATYPRENTSTAWVLREEGRRGPMASTASLRDAGSPRAHITCSERANGSRHASHRAHGLSGAKQAWLGWAGLQGRERTSGACQPTLPGAFTAEEDDTLPASGTTGLGPLPCTAA